MDHLDKTVQLKIQDIVEKLQKMECTLLGNADDAWVMELLFNPGFHRYHLVEWILSKFEYDVRKIAGPQNSPEERMKNLQTTVYNLGICRENSSDIIKGTASMEEQLNFWHILVDILWLKYDITGCSFLTDNVDEGVVLSPENCRRRIYEEYEDASACINNVCEFVNIKYLFKHDLQLLAPDVQREVEQLTPAKLNKYHIPSLQEFKKIANTTNPKELCKSLLCRNKIHVPENEEDLNELELNKLEDSMLKISKQVVNQAQGPFSDVYNELRPLILHSSPEEFTDVGPTFQKVEQNLETLLELKKGFLSLASSHSKLLQMNTDLDDLSNKNIADSESINITDILKGKLL